MKKSSLKNESVKSVKTGNLEELDPVEFMFSWNAENNPSEEFERLLTTLTVAKMDLITEDALPVHSWHHQKYTIQSVSVTGQPNYIQHNLRALLPSLVKVLESYTNCEVGHATKVYEFCKCKWLLRQFHFQTGMETGLYNLETKYIVHFKNAKWVELPYSQCVFSEKAQNELRLHHAIRCDFLDVLSQLVDLQLEALKVMSAKIELHPFPANKERENELLEIWVALKEDGQLDFLNNLKDRGRTEANLREQFFSIFNLNCDHYNDSNKRLKKIKNKAVVLIRLTELMAAYHMKK